MPAVDTSTRGPHGGRAGFNLNFSRLTRTDLITGGCSFLVFITLFLPWFGVSGYSKSGLSTHNFLVLVILTALAILGYLFMRAGWEEPPLRIPLGHTTTLLVAGGVQLLFVLLAVADAPSYTHHQFGAWLALLAALGAAVPAGIDLIRAQQAAGPASFGGMPATPHVGAPAAAYGAPPAVPSQQPTANYMQPAASYPVAPGQTAYAAPVQQYPPAGAPPGYGVPGAPGYAAGPGYQMAAAPTMGFGEAVRTVLSKYVDFSGRARRAEYWWWTLAVSLAFFGAFILDIMLAFSSANAFAFGLVLLFLISLAIFLPGLAVTVRRLHDTDRSGWWFLISLVPFGGIVLLVFECMEGTPGPNRYGPSPKGFGGYPYYQPGMGA